MDVQNYGGVVDLLVAAIANAGDHPNEVRRIVLTPAEMQEVQDSKAFTTTVSKYYGDSSTLIIDNIITDREGRYLSFYLGGILVVRHPSVPDYVATLTYPAGTAGTVGDFTVVQNANVELGLAIRKAGVSDNYNTAGTYEIAITEKDQWEFVVHAVSKNANVKNICELYLLTLELDVDPGGDSSMPPVVWTMRYSDINKGYVWSTSFGTNVPVSVVTSADQTEMTMTGRYSMDSLRAYMRGADFNEAGAPYGAFVVTLNAKPVWNESGSELSTEIMADITEYVQPA